MKFLHNKIPPPLVAALCGACMWGVSLISSTLDFPAVAKYLLMGLLLITGLVFLVLGAMAFRKAKTTVNPLKPDTATELVTNGVYAVSRNPMYVGFVFLMLAWAVYLASAWSLMFVALYIIYIHCFQIKPEEQALERLFGQQFVNYKGRVRPWL
ncbi:isoprenylcysteine carboxylmethyltransferase family protein [Aestuariicella hydrocarbonica]|uniref:Isoprenylcysteine carboxylmethyltransferase family protein n=1 Tax=Pseudomaricurvus hydrocarbonicus TaxID=1470433 RepID=A0A9E5MNZ9_9GAMM|nr:isoprenylcysteine carboxylmethyltransferase family protein [Aestuariicella hydrocarbonica]NHO67809.1 isoprenylcysteine carboxylmethyltransferase family protein [Aestuariicella hydrocarbonica]